jgi:RNA polymerase-binding transcription factor DksA
MSEDKKPDDSLINEFQTLGENLVNTFRAAWDNPERKRLQKEIEDGLVEMRSTMMQEVDSFSESSTGQRLKSDIDDFQDWVQNSNAEDQIREELIKALNIANTELKKVADKLSAIDSATDEPTEEGSETPSSGDEVVDG